MENQFQQYPLEEDILGALDALGYTQPTEIQAAVIPSILNGRDIIAKSKTGSGKTAAFAIPICNFADWEQNTAQALVLEPTRELAFQVKDELYAIGRFKRLKVPVLYGGFPMEKQILTLKQKTHIVVGTPGRVLDHCKRGTLDLSKVRYVVIDEADLMLDMGFIEDVRNILMHLEGKPVFMLFSATMGERLEALAAQFMHEPLEVKIENDTETADTIEQVGYFVDEDEKKLPLFLDILTMENPDNAMVFCGTREMVEVLYYRLRKEGIACGMLHGMIDQKVRTRTIEDFRAQGFRILIATDVAARGVDFQNITHVFNYDLPTNKEVYVHRIGRTGRAGETGRAVSLIREDEQKMLNSIESFTGVGLAILKPPAAEDVENARSAFLKRQRQKRPRKKKKQDVFGGQIMNLTIGGGKKSKLRSGDVVGAISSIDGVDGKTDIGAIDIRESITYVEILNGKGALVLEELPKRTMKGKIQKGSSDKRKDRYDNKMRHSIEMEKLTLGVCYYPEHWDRALWKDDLQRMKQYGIEVIRLAEFSWALMEPEEGKYDFSFWDEFLALAAEENMKVVFCTPTATPPAWLSEKYPETLNADGDGNLMYHGMRWQHNLTSPKYLEFCEKITRRMAEHFNKYDCIIGWQLDNEVNCETNEYYSKSDHEAFRAFLKERFGTLDNLNEKMGTIFWSQTYTDWDQIHLARRSTVGTGIANPHMQLEQVRFISHSAVHYLALQASIVRETAGDRFITTNGIFGNLDYQKLMESGVDFIMYDSYPNFAYAMDRPDGGEGDLKDRNSSFNLARTRAISPLFGIMEQQAGPGGWNFRIHQASPKPGQLRLWTMQSVAHGADFVSFFRWRTCSFGTEIYWHGLNDYSNRPNRRLEELSLVKADFEAIKDVAGHPYEAAVGILCDYDNEWDGQKDVWHGPLRNFSTDGWFRSLQKKHIPFDFVDFREETNLKDLEKYELLVYPHAAILTKERAEILTQYVANGGKLVMGCRTGYKDIYGRCPMQPMPGEAAELCGVTVEDFTFLAPGEPMEYVNWNKKRIPAPVFNDVLEPAFGGKAEGFFEGNYYDGKPALVTKNTGKGLAIYFGGCFAEETADAFLEALSIQTPAPWLVLPEGCELAKRGDQYFVLNYKAQACEITLKKKVTDRLTGNEIEGTYEVAPYGVLVLL